ncbi:MAG: hypothetical protein LC794_12955 [Acidobacteria bacterium]|nr:hypothetical protein [Acidobacteriota bacterium]MCA1627580.1 hypothetical protein [Acidobacteriota bacterium]
MTKAFLRREFLNPERTGQTSYILAEIDSSFNGKVIHGTNVIVIADCKRSIQLEFFLGGPQARVDSMDKIDLLLNVLGQFRETLKTQIQLIESAPIPDSRRKRST